MKKIKALLTIAPEENKLVNDVLSMTEDQIANKYGPLGDNIQFNIKLDSDLQAYLEIIPHKDRTATIEIQVIKEKGTLCCSQLNEREKLTGSYKLTNDDYEIEIIVEEDERLRRVGNQFIYKAIGEDERYRAHDGDICTVQRILTPQEADILVVGLMWEAQFPNGDVMHIFDSELEEPAHINKLNKSALSQQIKEAESKANLALNSNHKKSPER